MAGRIAVGALIGLAIGGGLGLLVGSLAFGSGTGGMAISVGTGVITGVLIGGALGWFRGLGQVSPREGPYDE